VPKRTSKKPRQEEVASPLRTSGEDEAAASSLEEPSQTQGASEDTPRAQSALPVLPAAEEGLHLLYRSMLATLENTPDAVFILDEHFHVCAFNPACARALGWRPQEVIGRGCAEVLKCRDLSHMDLCGTASCPLVRVLRSKQALPNEELIIGGEPVRAWEVSVSVTPVDIGQGLHMVFSARDVSALTMANRLRANFVSMVSHELRTPLNSVQGFIDLLLRGHMGRLTEDQQEYLGYARESVQLLLSTVEDILFITRADSGQFEIDQQKVRADLVVEQVLQSVQAQARKAEIILSSAVVHPAPLIYADPQRVIQVLRNLVGNALKFTPPGGSVLVRTLPDPDDPRMARFSVADTGFGIAPEDQPHVFEHFYQAHHAMQSRVGGYGLGLTIAQLIVEQHGGRIWFDSTARKGTTFYFTVPLYTEALSAEEQS
jgi:signal transduction histidine kinase